MPELPTHRVRPRPPMPLYIDGCGALRFGRRPTVRRSTARLLASARKQRSRLAWIAELVRIAEQHQSGFEDIRGACCGK